MTGICLLGLFGFNAVQVLGFLIDLDFLSIIGLYLKRQQLESHVERCIAEKMVGVASFRMS